MTRRPVLHALTLHRPWCWAIARAGKDVENRTWAPPAWLCGQWLAIYSGKAWDDLAADAMRSLGIRNVPTPESWPPGRIVALARVSHWTTQPHGKWKKDGSVGWVLRDVLAIDGPSMRGAQGLWRVQAPYLPAIRAAYRAARGSVDTGKESGIDSRA